MKKLVASLFIFSLLVFCGGPSALATGAQAGNSSSSGKAEAPAKTTTHHHHAMSGKMARSAAKPETISGTIAMVDAAKKIVVLTDSNGVPFDFIVTHGTHIQVNGSKASLSQLADQTNKQASVKFIDRMKAGQFARSIDVSQ